MKNSLRILEMLMLTGVVLGLMAACGKKDDGGGGDGTAIVAGQCQAGFIYGGAQYGCLQQGSCGNGYGVYNNQCVYVGNVAGQCGAGYLYAQQYGCVPQGNCGAGYGIVNNQCVYIGYNTGIAGGIGGAGSCAAGTSYAGQQYGCVTQCGNSTMYGVVNNQCIYVGNMQYSNGMNNGYNPMGGGYYYYNNRYYGNGYPYYGGGVGANFYLGGRVGW